MEAPRLVKSGPLRILATCLPSRDKGLLSGTVVTGGHSTRRASELQMKVHTTNVYLSFQTQCNPRPNSDQPGQGTVLAVSERLLHFIGSLFETGRPTTNRYYAKKEKYAQ
jgi:hypothetical protein